MIFAGGVPLRRDGLAIGAIGVSGGTGSQDESVVMAGALGLYELQSERALRDMQRIGQLRYNRRNIAKAFLGRYANFFILYPEAPPTSAAARMRPSEPTAARTDSETLGKEPTCSA
jgi:hypothetical protein